MKVVENECGGHAINRDTLLAPALAGNDPDRPLWHAEAIGELV